MTLPPAPDLPRRAAVALRVTQVALWWEVLARAFWPAASVIIAGGATLALGAAGMPLVGPWLGYLWLAASGLLLWLGWRRLRPPTPEAAMARVDAGLAGRPLAALSDRIAVGADDPGSAALWAAHRARAREVAARARPAPPRANLARRDPYGLRILALTLLAMALIFGHSSGLGTGWGAFASAPAPQPARPDATPPARSAWEGWAEPPAHTRRPTIYLNAIPEGEVLSLPQGSLVTLRLYGDGIARQSIGPDTEAATPEAPAFTAAHDGRIELPGGRRIAVTVIPDAPPVVQAGTPAARRADGRLVQPFTASDDYGVTAGEAEIALDLAAVPRSFGLATEPEAREPLSIALPLPARGRDAVQGALSTDLARHAYANLPVIITLRVEDGLGQTGEATPLHMTLPGRRFFDPGAAALIELRQSLMWSRENRAEAAQWLRAVTWQPEGFLSDEVADGLAAVIARMETGPLDTQTRDDLAEILWQTAVALEDGGLSDALERMQRAQARLSEAIRQGASPDEIARLMRELREATDDYTRMLAEQGAAPEERFTRQQPTERLTANQLQEMMAEIERLMNEGRMAEAQELLEQFNRLMENLRITQGDGAGDGFRGGQGGQSNQQGSMGGLTDTLREQQRLADEAMRRQRGADGRWQPLGSGDADDLAERQRDLREQLGRERGLMPGQGSDAGNDVARRLDEAGRAMDEAERALREGDVGGAMERQADAIAALREGMRRLGQMDGRDDQQQPGGDQQAETGEGGEGSDRNNRATGQTGQQMPRVDPLGRDMAGQGGSMTTDAPMAEGEADPNRRARDLQDEIRRRAGQMERPSDERDYLGRLLDRF